VFHVGAVPNWLYPYGALRGPNVVGTREALRLCATGPVKPLHHLSTLGVVLSSRDFSEQVLYENIDLDQCSSHPIGYTQSKWVAEKLVQQARAVGVPSSIHRPAFVSGDSETGVCKTAGDFVFAYIRASIQLGVTHERDWLVSIVPVDFVARSIVVAARSPNAIGQDYHYPNPEPLRWQTLVEWLRDFGYRIDARPLDDWIHAIRAAGPECDLAGFLPLLTPTDGKRSVYDVGYLREDVRVDSTHLERVLDAIAVKSAAVTKAVFHRYLTYMVDHGLVPRPG
jgi:thioester reductase-like protein